jgi:DNA-binding SARP family transcriptional activator/Flp pilus assembly protein TadD
MSILHIQLLGEFRLVYNNAPLALHHATRLHSLLAWLLLHAGVPQPRAYLAYTLWPDSSEEQARTNLRKRFFELRQALPHPDLFLAADATTLYWRHDAPYVLDVAEFEHSLANERSLAAVARAVSLYGGDLLPGCYDDWIVPERERLRQAFLDLLAEGVALAEAEQEYQTAIRYAQQLLRHDPLHEETYQSLMRLHALSGDRAAALRVYHTCADTLAQELGIKPGLAICALYKRLLGSEKFTSQPLAPRLKNEPVSMPPLVGRNRQWAQLRSAWQRALSGQSHVVLLSGEPGMGKTRLAEELCEWVTRQGTTAVSTRCYAAEGVLAYGPLATLLRSYPLPRLDPIWLSELARLMPELHNEWPDLPLPGPMTEGWQRQRLFEALARALLAQQPLLILVDDLQWCDRDSLDFLHYLLRFDPQARLLLLCTLRMNEIDTASSPATLWSDLRGSGRLTEIEVPPLDLEGATALAKCVSGSEFSRAQAERLFVETEGNPLFVLEMVRAGVLDDAAREPMIPATIRSVIAERLVQLSAEAQELVGVAATIGRAFRFPVLLHASDWDEGAVVRGLDELWRRRLVREQGADAYDFSHDKIREVAYERLSTARKRLLHRRVARALETIYADTIDAVSGEIAAHLQRAGMLTQAGWYYVRAGNAARQVYANAAAIDYYERALLLLPATAHAEILVNLAEVLALVGSYTEALTALEQAAAMYSITADRGNFIRVLAQIGRIHADRGTAEEGLRRLQKVLDEIEPNDISPDYVLLYTALARLCLRSGRYVEGLISAERAAALAHQLGEHPEGVRLQAEVESRRGVLLMKLGRSDDARCALETASQLAEAAGDLPNLITTLSNLSVLAQSQGELDVSAHYNERALEMAQRRGDPAYIAFLTTRRGMAFFFSGEWRRALEEYWRAANMSQRIDRFWGSAYPLIDLVRLYLAMGEWKEASHRLQELADFAKETEDLQVMRLAQVLRAEWDLIEGRYQAALDRLTPFLDRSGLEESDVTELLPFLASVYLEMGDIAQAETLVSQSVKRAIVQHRALDLLETLQLQGILRTRQGRWVEAERSLQEALSLAQHMRYPYAEARVKQAQGLLHAARGETEHAQARLQEALDMFHRLGAHPYAKRAVQALTALHTAATPALPDNHDRGTEA